MSSLFKVNKKKVLFIHLPRTGGTSMCRSLKLPVLGHQPITKFKQKPFPFSLFCKKPFSFAFVRNPWDRVVSIFFLLNGKWTNKKNEADRKTYVEKYNGNFNDFVLESFNGDNPLIFNQQHFKPQYLYVCDEKGDIAVDFIGKYENIQEDFDKVCDKIGLGKIELIRENVSVHKDYREYYNEKTKEIIRKAYQKDIELFDYGF